MYSVETMDQRVGQSLATRRFSMVLLTLFAALALTLSGIGAYGAMAYLVSQSTRDIGIRMALGATQSNILGVVVWRGLRLALAGVGIGVVGAFALSHVMKSLLFGIAPTDAVTYAGTCLLLLAIGLSASYFPARQAARTDPSVSLRCE
jgi:putative ABC transport system permease protein